MDHLSEIVEINQHGFHAKRIRDIIMKSIIFIMIAAIICAVVFIGLETRKNVYFKRMQSLISSLAGLKSDLKACAHILKTSAAFQSLSAEIGNLMKISLWYNTVRPET